MKKLFVFQLILIAVSMQIAAQKIVPIEHNGKKYEVADMTSKGKVMWGGYNDEIAGDAAKSESNGSANTKAIVTIVGNNAGFEGKPYLKTVTTHANFPLNIFLIISFQIAIRICNTIFINCR